MLTEYQSALTINTRVIRILIQVNDQSSIPISENLRLQVLPDMSHLGRCAKHQFAAFIADRQVLVVWDDQPEKLIRRAQALEKSIMDLIWNMDAEQEISEKGNKSSGVSVHELQSSESQEDLSEKPRRIVLLHSITTAITLCLIIVTLGAGFRKLALEIATDHTYIRVALVATAPVTMWVSSSSRLWYAGYSRCSVQSARSKATPNSTPDFRQSDSRAIHPCPTSQFSARCIRRVCKL
jgi:hypothetical protein